MWPSQCWGVLQDLPRSLCLKQSLKCWALAFPLQTPQQQNAPTVLRTASPPLNHHGYKTHDLLFLPSSSWLDKLTFLLRPLFLSFWRYPPWLSVYLCALILVVPSLYVILFVFFINLLYVQIFNCFCILYSCFDFTLLLCRPWRRTTAGTPPLNYWKTSRKLRNTFLSCRVSSSGPLVQHR